MSAAERWTTDLAPWVRARLAARRAEEHRRIQDVVARNRFVATVEPDGGRAPSHGRALQAITVLQVESVWQDVDRRAQLVSELARYAASPVEAAHGRPPETFSLTDCSYGRSEAVDPVVCVIGAECIRDEQVETAVAVAGCSSTGADVVSLFSQEIVLFTSFGAAGQHRSYTRIESPTATYLSATPSVAVLVEALVHESAHNLFNTTIRMCPDASTGATYYSPWRGESRPPYFFLHAVHAFSLVAIAAGGALRSTRASELLGGTAPLELRLDEVRRRLDMVERSFRDCVVREGLDDEDSEYLLAVYDLVAEEVGGRAAPAPRRTGSSPRPYTTRPMETRWTCR